jgi:NADH-quinone oxidoreductase subunit J
MTLMVAMPTVVFWIFAPIIVLLSFGMILARKIVHSALCLIGVMVCLAIIYASLDAPFLFVAQIMVYTGSVMMLFLFTMMLMGVDSVEEFKESVKGHRILSAIVLLALLVLLIAAVATAIGYSPLGLDQVNDASGGNAVGIAFSLFSRYAFVFELASALVITAALAAMVLSHHEALAPKERQRAKLERAMREYAATGENLVGRPSSGVFARDNSIMAPAPLPDGSTALTSISPTLVERDAMKDLATELSTMAKIRDELLFPDEEVLVVAQAVETPQNPRRQAAEEPLADFADLVQAIPEHLRPPSVGGQR